MEINLSKSDRMIRFVVGLSFLSLWFFGTIIGILGFMAGLLSLYAIATSVLAHDPIYRLLNFSTLEAEQKE